MSEIVADAELVEQADCRYGRMAFLRTDSILGRSLREYGEWAQAEIDLLDSLVAQSAVVLDVGAHIGTHSLGLARRPGSARTVFSFEPHPFYRALLEQNIRTNGYDNIQLHPQGLAEEIGELAFSVRDLAGAENFGGARLEPISTEGGQIVVPVQTLDSLALTECDLIKIDAEGMEAPILRGAMQTLARCHPIVYCECNSAEEGWPVLDLMRSAGFVAYMHCFDAFNPSNFKANPKNFFGLAREIGLLFVARERAGGDLYSNLARRRVVAIDTLDDLLLGLLRKPQYKYEVLANTRAGTQFGVDFILNESDRNQLLERIAVLENAETLAHQRANELAELGRRLDTTQAALDEAQALAWERAGQLNELSDELTRLMKLPFMKQVMKRH